ncbi:unnamed protein product [Triticum turgidum subsp. durum]|uniref:3-deoxy-D-manno-octulosonic-acid transferase N-terminal domain-containing protein n=1 Tax=Triticum turgidum subsp. durum TaxID=4567 RepID=A0A9R0VQK2_TRITD|nr:unnamed protein product [Triticum turgidum subsp. durum]
MAALPVVRHCARLHPGLPILLTTTTLSAFEVIKDLLPDVVIYQFAPLDCPDAIESFIGYWKPSLILLMESELWPNLIMSAAEKGSFIVLTFENTFGSEPTSGTILKVREKELNTIKDLQRQFNDRPIWMAASIHRGEEEVLLRVHDELIKAYASLLLILVPRHPQDIKNVSLALKKQKVNFVLRSTMELVSINTRVYVVDTLVCISV